MKQPRHLVSATDFTATELQGIFERTQFYKFGFKIFRWPLDGLLGSLLFYEPSTRTRLSFESAIMRLGGRFSSTESAGHFSSAAKGETLEDTIRVVSDFYHFIILRHPENGAAERAAKVATVPIINAGDGSSEHPTQALLDFFTIWEAIESGRLPRKELRVLFLGDNSRSRTVRSLALMLSIYAHALGIHLGWLGFSGVDTSSKPPAELLAKLQGRERLLIAHDDGTLIDQADVIYLTRLQRERYQQEDRIVESSTSPFGQAHLDRLKPHAIIMHPLPRVDELAHTIDTDDRAWYFKQSRNGLFVRMALLEMLLGD